MQPSLESERLANICLQDVVNLRVDDDQGHLEVPLPTGNVIKFHLPDAEDEKKRPKREEFNFSEAVNKSGLWKSMEGSQADLKGFEK